MLRLFMNAAVNFCEKKANQFALLKFYRESESL